MSFARPVLCVFALLSGLGGALAQSPPGAPERQPTEPPPGVTLAPRWNPKTTTAMPIFQQYCEVKIEDVKGAKAKGQVVSCPPGKP